MGPIVSFGNVSTTQKNQAVELGASCFSWEEFQQLGNLDWDLPSKKRAEICAIMYTRGTTAEVLSIDQLLLLIEKVGTEQDAFFSFFPLAHVYDHITESYCIYKGSSIGFWQGEVRFLMEDIQALKPTIFCGVPRVFDRIYAGLAEGCGGFFSAIANVFSMVGTVGVSMTNIEARLESVP
ncbi:hypothetical protein L6164_031960 [Bauhinia variegata]|uniref:Uncharacterized protein n=1 Tax=Bauhinia variegata TaxID=167791 RepID=A0ACB9KMA5_BAUVA|nr:hypothetical protein L6164_031960 [Bauhinia variegata]